MQLRSTVDEGGIGITVGIKICPREIRQAGDSRKWLNLSEGGVAVISQDDWSSSRRAEDDVQIAFSLDVRAPRSDVLAVGNSRGKFCLGGDVGESSRTVLPEQTHTTIACEHEISFEVVTKIDR